MYVSPERVAGSTAANPRDTLDRSRPRIPPSPTFGAPRWPPRGRRWTRGPPRASSRRWQSAPPWLGWTRGPCSAWPQRRRRAAAPPAIYHRHVSIIAGVSVGCGSVVCVWACGEVPGVLLLGLPSPPRLELGRQQSQHRVLEAVGMAESAVVRDGDRRRRRRPRCPTRGGEGVDAGGQVRVRVARRGPGGRGEQQDLLPAPAGTEAEDGAELHGAGPGHGGGGGAHADSQTLSFLLFVFFSRRAEEQWGRDGREGGREDRRCGLFGGTAHTRAQVIWKGIGTSAHRGASHASCIQHASLSCFSLLLQAGGTHPRPRRQEEKEKKNGHETTPTPTLAD